MARTIRKFIPENHGSMTVGIYADHGNGVVKHSQYVYIDHLKVEDEIEYYMALLKHSDDESEKDYAREMIVEIASKANAGKIWRVDGQYGDHRPNEYHATKNDALEYVKTVTC